MTSVRYGDPEDVTPGAVSRGETPVVVSLDNSSVTACTSRGNDTPPLVLSEVEAKKEMVWRMLLLLQVTQAQLFST